MDIYTLLYLKWITNRDLLHSSGNSAQCYVAAPMGGQFVGECIHVYVWLSPFAVHLKLSQHCLSAMCVQTLSGVQLFATPWTVACQYPLSMGFSSREYWSGVPLPFPILYWSVAN